MRKLTRVLIAGCMSVAVTGAFAAQGSPADTDKAGRAGPGTAAGQMGAADPSPGKAGPGATGAASGMRSGTGATTGAGGSSATTGTGASSSTTSSGASASTGTGEPKAKRSRRAGRATRG